MTTSTRKFVGMLILFAFLVIYVMLAMAVAIVMGVNTVGWVASLAYHALAGLLWVPVAAYIIWWMSQEPKHS